MKTSASLSLPGIVAVGLLAGCSGLGSSSSALPGVGSQATHAHGLQPVPLGVVPSWAHPVGIARLRLNDRIAPAKAKGYIYASEFEGDQVFGYPNPNSNNGPATCRLGTSSNYLDDINGFGTDSVGDTMIPALTPNDSGKGSINVFAPGCGALAWQAEVNVPDAAATNSKSAVTGSVLVAEQSGFGNFGGAGGAVICSAKSGCGTPLTNSDLKGYAVGVAMAKNGDCWISGATNMESGFVLVYFSGCTGSGVVATGTSNKSYGGLFIDTKGNLGSVDGDYGKLYVYSGCNPACTLVSTSTLHGYSLYGTLDKKGENLALGDYGNGTVDVYSYSPTSGATYSYSFDNGLTEGDYVEAAAFAPSNKI